MKAKFVIAIIILASVAVAVYFFLKKRKNGGDSNGGGSSSSSSSGSSSNSSSSSSSGSGNDNFPLRYGSRGTRVRGLQYIINGVSGNSSLLTVDGIWGKKTDSAVKQYIARTGSINYNEWETFVPLWNKYVEALKKDREFASNNNGMQLGTAILAMETLKRKLPVN